MLREKGIEEESKTEDSATTRHRDYQLRPKLNERFQVNTVKELIASVLSEKLLGRTYDATESVRLTLNIADRIKARIVETGLQQRHYKLVVIVSLGEQRGEGVRMCSRALWDADTDTHASHLFLNDSIFCMAVVFAIFVY